MSYIGNLRQYHLNDVLRLIGDGLRRGRLVVERGGLRAELYCENGFLMHVWRNGAMPSLAQQWIAANLLTASALTQIGAQLNADPQLIPDNQLAQTAVDLGMMSPEQVTSWAMSDAVMLLGILFSWSDGDYRFEEGMVPPAGRVRVPLPIPLVLNTLVQRTASWQVAHPTITVSPSNVLDFADIEPTYPQSIQLTHEQWRLMTLVDGESTVAQIAAHLTRESGQSPQLDQQRYEMELHRFEEDALRVASELVNEGIAVVVK